MVPFASLRRTVQKHETTCYSGSLTQNFARPANIEILQYYVLANIQTWHNTDRSI